MLEILLLAFLCTRMGATLRSKGWKPLFMQVMVVITWVCAMFLGAIAYGVYVVITQGPEALENIGFAVYPWALLSAALGQGVVFLVAWLLPDRTQPEASEGDPLEPR